MDVGSNYRLIPELYPRMGFLDFRTGSDCGEVSVVEGWGCFGDGTGVNETTSHLSNPPRISRLTLGSGDNTGLGSCRERSVNCR